MLFTFNSLISLYFFILGFAFSIIGTNLLHMFIEDNKDNNFSPNEELLYASLWLGLLNSVILIDPLIPLLIKHNWYKSKILLFVFVKFNRNTLLISNLI